MSRTWQYLATKRKTEQDFLIYFSGNSQTQSPFASEGSKFPPSSRTNRAKKNATPVEANATHGHNLSVLFMPSKPADGSPPIRNHSVQPQMDTKREAGE